MESDETYFTSDRSPGRPIFAGLTRRLVSHSDIFYQLIINMSTKQGSVYALPYRISIPQGKILFMGRAHLDGFPKSMTLKYLSLWNGIILNDFIFYLMRYVGPTLMLRRGNCYDFLAI